MTATHTRAAIVSIGDELVLGQALDTNSRWLSARLLDLGIPTIAHVTVADDRAATARTFARLAAEAPLVISTGGLGPTADDLTREALADALGEGLLTDAAALDSLAQRFAAAGRPMNDLQRRQALWPISARCLPNDNGTAPGLHAVLRRTDARVGGGHDATDVYCLPGPPGELRPMFEVLVAPCLRSPPGTIIRTRFMHAVGIGEAEAAQRLGDLMRRGRSPLVGITASGAVLTVRIRYEGDLAPAMADEALDRTEREAAERLAPYVFGAGDDTLGASVVREMAGRGRTLAVVESCTGGLLGQTVTAVAGSSSVFVGGWITYSDRLKREQVGVPGDLLERHGAVSAEVGGAMAVGGLERSGADDCLAITGIAGPGGATPGKPVGTVFIAHASRREGSPAVGVRRFRFGGEREDVRLRSAVSALAMLRFALAGHVPGEPPLLWERPLRGE